MEIWKQVKDYPKYEVSSMGRVKSYQGKSPTILKGHFILNRYHQVSLSNGIKKINIFIHRLVLLHFQEHEIDKNYGLHINHITLDNRNTNLKWATLGDVRRHHNEFKKKIRGVYQVKIRGCTYWVPKLKINNKLKTLGYFKDKEEALFKFVEEYKNTYKSNPW
jgi:hypothetical protein